MDSINSFYVQLNHTSKIRDPEILSDIIVLRWVYWPGLESEARFLKGKCFSEIKEKILLKDGLFNPAVVESDYLMASALLRKDTSSLGEEYVQNSDAVFLARVIKSIASQYSQPTKELKQAREDQVTLNKILTPSILSTFNEHFDKFLESKFG